MKEEHSDLLLKIGNIEIFTCSQSKFCSSSTLDIAHRIYNKVRHKGM